MNIIPWATSQRGYHAVISCGALSKRYLVPGLRCGWLVIYDRLGLLKDSVSLKEYHILQIV